MLYTVSWIPIKHVQIKWLVCLVREERCRKICYCFLSSALIIYTIPCIYWFLTWLPIYCKEIWEVTGEMVWLFQMVCYGSSALWDWHSYWSFGNQCMECACKRSQMVSRFVFFCLWYNVLQHDMLKYCCLVPFALLVSHLNII